MSELRSILSSTPRWPMAITRILLGVMWLATLRWKLPPDFAPGGEDPGLHAWLVREVEQPSFDWYGNLIDSVVLPNFVFFAWLVFLAELFVGLSLLAGVFVRPAALLGVLMSFNLWLGLRAVEGEWQWTYVLMMLLHAGVLLSAASTTWSLSSSLPVRVRKFSDLWNSRVPASPGKGSLAAAVVRSGLGVITLVTWRSNIEGDFYDGESFAGFFDWVSKPVEEDGNGASLGFVHSLVDATVLQSPEFFGWVMTFLELFIGVGLLLGIFTRAASLAAAGFFGSLFLVYFGGEEWIFIYVMLTLAAVVSFFMWGGRKFGADQVVAASNGESPGTLIW